MYTANYYVNNVYSERLRVTIITYIELTVMTTITVTVASLLMYCQIRFANYFTIIDEVTMGLIHFVRKINIG